MQRHRRERTRRQRPKPLSRKDLSHARLENFKKEAHTDIHAISIGKHIHFHTRFVFILPKFRRIMHAFGNKHHYWTITTASRCNFGTHWSKCFDASNKNAGNYQIFEKFGPW